MTDYEIETSPSEAVTSEDVKRQIRTVTDPLTQQLAHLCELMKELRDAHAHRRHEETASSWATSSSTGGTSRSNMVTKTLNPAFAPLSTLAPPAGLTSPEFPPQQRVFSHDDEEEESAANTSSQVNQVVINSLPAILLRDVTQTKRLKCYKHKCPVFDGLKINSTNSSIYSSTTCNLINTGSRKRTNYTSFKTSRVMKPSSFGKHWRSTQKPPFETYFSNSDKNLLSSG